MKYSKIFQDRIDCSNEEQVFDYLINTLKTTITKWDYFVNWAKVFGNVRDFEIELNLFNYLIGKDDIEKEFIYLVQKHPSTKRLLPALLGCRQKEFEILTDYGYSKFEYDLFSFKKPTQIEPEKALEFAKGTGLLDLFKTRKIKNIVDYLIGVEVGLDSNGRKNRTGDMMESIVKFFVNDICTKCGFDYISQATAAKIKKRWGIKIRVDKASRKIDFAVNNGNRLYLIETNFYGGVGSKLKSTAGEYVTMFNFWKEDGHEFIWVTDGRGWLTTKRPLQETFSQIDYILNLEMVSKGLLKDIICEDIT